MGRGTHAIRENAKPGHAGTGAPWPILCSEDNIIFGSTVIQTDFDGAVVWQGDYAPFGESLEAQPVNWGNPYTFLGNEDDGGLMDFGARWYDASIGRFYSPDPIKDVSNSNIVNPYAYCSNNPMRYTDKYGLSQKDDCILGDIPMGGGGGGGGGEYLGGMSVYVEGYGWVTGDAYFVPAPMYACGWATVTIFAVSKSQGGALNALVTTACGLLNSAFKGSGGTQTGSSFFTQKSEKQSTRVDLLILVPTGSINGDGEILSSSGPSRNATNEFGELVNQIEDSGRKTAIFYFGAKSQESINTMLDYIASSNIIAETAVSISHGGLPAVNEVLLTFKGGYTMLQGSSLITSLNGHVTDFYSVLACHQKQSNWASIPVTPTFRIITPFRGNCWPRDCYHYIRSIMGVIGGQGTRPGR